MSNKKSNTQIPRGFRVSTANPPQFFTVITNGQFYKVEFKIRDATNGEISKGNKIVHEGKVYELNTEILNTLNNDEKTQILDKLEWWYSKRGTRKSPWTNSMRDHDTLSSTLSSTILEYTKTIRQTPGQALRSHTTIQLQPKINDINNENKKMNDIISKIEQLKEKLKRTMSDDPNTKKIQEQMQINDKNAIKTLEMELYNIKINIIKLNQDMNINKIGILPYTISVYNAYIKLKNNIEKKIKDMYGDDKSVTKNTKDKKPMYQYYMKDMKDMIILLMIIYKYDTELPPILKIIRDKLIVQYNNVSDMYNVLKTATFTEDILENAFKDLDMTNKFDNFNEFNELNTLKTLNYQVRVMNVVSKITKNQHNFKTDSTRIMGAFRQLLLFIKLNSPKYVTTPVFSESAYEMMQIYLKDMNNIFDSVKNDNTHVKIDNNTGELTIIQKGGKSKKHIKHYKQRKPKTRKQHKQYKQ